MKQSLCPLLLPPAPRSSVYGRTSVARPAQAAASFERMLPANVQVILQLPATRQSSTVSQPATPTAASNHLGPARRPRHPDRPGQGQDAPPSMGCLLYTSDAADD